MRTYIFAYLLVIFIINSIVSEIIGGGSSSSSDHTHSATLKPVVRNTNRETERYKKHKLKMNPL